jgi:hypothetical protein
MATNEPFNQKQRYLCLILPFIVLSGSAKHYTPEVYSDPYGFFSGLWHGFVFPFSLLANLISWCASLVGIDVLFDIQIIGRPNTGFFFYYVGFIFGLSTYGGASS